MQYFISPVGKYLSSIHFIHRHQFKNEDYDNIMNKTYRELFEEEKQLSTALAKQFGYQIKAPSLDSRFKRQNEGKTPIVANITCLKLVKPITKTDKILQIQEQLRGIENGRLLEKFKQNEQSGSLPKQSPVIRMMQQRIRQYNYIVEHRHLNKNFAAQTRKILKIQRQETQELVQKIQKQQQRLMQGGNLQGQISINKYMTTLYKTYQQKLQSRRPASTNAFKTKTMVSEPAKSAKFHLKHQQMPKHIRTRQGTQQYYEKTKPNTKSDKTLVLNLQQVNNNLHHTEAHPNLEQYPYFGYLTQRPSMKETSRQRRERFQKTIRSPFLEKDLLDKYKKIQKLNLSNRQALALIKTKIEDHRTVDPSFFLPSKTKHHQSEHRSLRQQFRPNNRSVDDPQVAQSRHKHEQQRFIFAQILRKKHNKFNKIGLSKVMVKYDEQRQAKFLLKGQPNNTTNSHILPKGTPSFDSQQNENDEDYERMCKNEKINLLLKRK